MDSFQKKYNRETEEAKRDAREVLNSPDCTEKEIFKRFQERAKKDLNPVMIGKK